MALGDPWADPSTIPELQTIIRRRLLSKVRIFESWCENGDRLLQVIKVNGRPLALARGMLKVGGASTRLAHRGTGQAMWMDLPIDTYISSRRLLSLEPTCRTEQVFFMRISAHCAHERISIPADWLPIAGGDQESDPHRRTRWEMVARPRGT